MFLEKYKGIPLRSLSGDPPSGTVPSANGPFPARKGVKTLGHFPIHLDLMGRNVLVVGGGEVACRKVVSLLAAGGVVTVIAPRLTGELCLLVERGVIQWERRPFETGDTRGYLLVFAATDDPSANHHVIRDARREKVLVCRVDDPQGGDFVTPALFRDGDLLVSVGCGGVPSLAAAIRDRIARDLGEGWGERIDSLRRTRENLLTRSREHPYNKKILRRLFHDVAAHVREGRFDGIASLVDGEEPKLAGTVTSSGGDQ